ncbi:MAG: PAS domain-containing sensor histidine kinase [Polaromonas sp.]
MLNTDKEGVLLDLILNSMSEGVIAVDTGGHFLLFNDTARKLFTVPEPGTLFNDWRRCNPLLTLDRQAVDRDDGPLTQTLRGARIDNRELVFRRPGAEERVLSMSTRPLRDAGDALIGGVLVFNDITERKAAEDFALAQEQVLALIAGGTALPQSLEAIVRLVEKSSPGSLCSILLLQGQVLRHGAAPSLPDSYNQAIDGLQIGDGAGACGTVAFRKQPVVVEDAERDPLMRDYRELLRMHDLRACWSTPVLASNGEVLATFAIYRRTPGKPQARDAELIATATRLARIALERAHAEAALVDSEARFRELAENIDDVFFNVDAATGRMLYISPGYEKIGGRSCKSLYANPRSYLDAVVTEDRSVLKRANQRNQAGEQSDVEYRIVASDGKMRWIRDRRYPVFNPAGKVERVVGSSRDITERKLADLALAGTNRALQMLGRTSMAINRSDDEAHLLAEVCRVAVEVGGYRMAWVGYAQDDEARSIQPVAHAGDESGYLAAIEISWQGDHPTGQGPAGRAIRSGQPEHSGDITGSANFHWREAALQRGYRSAICLPLRDGPSSFGVLCLYAGEAQQFAADEVRLLQELADNLAFGIASLRARLARNQAREEIVQLNASLEERVQQRTAQLAFANKQMESFSYSVSHDLRSPLNAIDGFSSLLEKTVGKMEGGPLTERGAHYLARIRAGVSQMGELIDALLTLAQVSRASLLWEPVDLSALAEALLSSYREHEPARVTRWQVEAGLLAQGDPRLLKQVLDNLLGNAWKFSAGQSCTEITFSHEQGNDGDTVYFVRDNGAGFDMAYADKLFGTFQRLHTQDEFAGTGIGLATVQRIIVRHGGKIWGESAPGQGATFYFTLGTAAP